MTITRIDKKDKWNKREVEQMKEDMRKDITHDVAKYTKCSPSFKVARFVDREILDKTVLHQYGRFKQSMRKAEYSDDVINKARHTQTFDGKHLMITDVPRDLSIEKLYFDTYGTGFDGRSTPTSMHQAYICPKCGLKTISDPAVMDMKCPRCGYTTPIGQIVKDGVYRRWRVRFKYNKFIHYICQIYQGTDSYICINLMMEGCMLVKQGRIW